MVGGIVDFGGDQEGYAETILGKVMLAFFRFIKEPWISVEHPGQQRQLSRQYERETGHPPDVNVITLRKAKRREGADESDARDVEWSCRWMVSAHWRNQWYPSLGEHRPRLILPYLKGPDDKPFKAKATVFSVSR